MQSISRVLATSFALSLLVLPLIASVSFSKESKWEPDIKKFEQQDAKQMPPKNSILFVGSSSIRKWDLKKSFPDLNAINRGFGGSEVSDSIEFADRIILKHEPRIVVIYAGDNDIAHDETPQQVFSNYQELVGQIHAKLPMTKIVYIAVKPSIKRWGLIEQVRETNRLISTATSKDKRLVFVDIDKPMIGDDGKPRKELFVKDGLHLSEEGYALWASLVRPHLIGE